MRRWKWLAVLAAVGVLATAFVVTSAFAHGPTNPRETAPYESWGDEMYDFCHGADGTGGMMGGWGIGFHMGPGDPVTLERVADTLGLTYEELTARLAQGETIAQIAQTEGVDASLVVDTILAPQSEMLQVRVKYGYLSEAQSQAILEQARLRAGQAIAEPLYGFHGSTYGTTGGYTQGYTPNYGGGAWRGPGGMMGGGMTGGGMMGGGMMGW